MQGDGPRSLERRQERRAASPGNRQTDRQTEQGTAPAKVNVNGGKITREDEVRLRMQRMTRKRRRMETFKVQPH